jgi:hypothetical protein
MCTHVAIRLLEKRTLWFYTIVQDDTLAGE